MKPTMTPMSAKDLEFQDFDTYIEDLDIVGILRSRGYEAGTI